MIWKGYGMYAQSDKGYRVSKGFINVDVPKFIAYGQDGAMLECPAFFKYSEARDACESHYNEKNKQTY